MKNMNQSLLQSRVEHVGNRVCRLQSWRWRTLFFVILTIVALGLIVLRRFGGVEITAPMIIAVLGSGVVVAFLLQLVLVRSVPAMDTARKIEERHPDLADGLLAALEQKPTEPDGELRYLQQTVVDKALKHSRYSNWNDVVPASRLRRWILAGLGSVGLFLTASIFVFERPQAIAFGRAPLASEVVDPTKYDISVDPGDTEIEKGKNLLVMARFGGKLPAKAELTLSTEQGEPQRFVMRQSLNDNLFAARVPSVTRAGSYTVSYDDRTAGPFSVSVFQFPELQQADVVISFPEYTDRKLLTVQDTRRVTVVEGAKVKLICRLNKAVTSAELRDETGNVVPLESDGAAVRTITLTAAKTRKFKLHLTDDRGRTNRFPPDFAINVTPNRRPDLKLAFPGRDRPVSPLEELAVEAKISDDFGLEKYGVVYGLAGVDPTTVELGRKARAKKPLKAAYTMLLEQMKAEPDQLVSYYFFADDFGPDGEVRRTFSDMYFAEVRRFDEIFRQGQPQTQQQQRQQQQQQQNQQRQQQGQKVDQLAQLQKQIINATWKLIRQERPRASTEAGRKFASDVELVAESQETARTNAEKLVNEIQDPSLKQRVGVVVDQMSQAVTELSKFSLDGNDTLQGALAQEQAAYQTLLRLRANEFNVRRQRQRQQQQGQQGQQGNRSQQQLNQLELNNKRNRYQTQSQARQQQQQANQQQLRTLNRLRELARRQEAINEKLKQLESELRQAKSEQEREELERQLKRLRDEQQQMLRDIDEAAEEIDKQQKNQQNEQQQNAEAREKLDQARQRARQTSEALKKGQVSKALTEGTRTERDLKNLRDEFRERTANHFSDQMRDMRQEARDVEKEEKEIATKIAEAAKSRSLNYQKEREAIEQRLRNQSERVQDLQKNMRRMVEQSEEAEPLLASTLYDAARKLKDKPPEADLDAARFLVERGFLDQAREAEGQARKNIENMREGIEKAAETVLGNELDALRRAREEIDELRKQLGDELAAADPEEAARVNRQQKESQKSDSQQSPAGRQQSQQKEGKQREGQRQPNGRQRQDRQPPRRQSANGQQGRQRDGQQGRQRDGQQGRQRDGQQRRQDGRQNQQGNQQPPQDRPAQEQRSRQQNGQPGTGQPQPNGDRRQPSGEQQNGQQQQQQNGQQGNGRQQSDQSRDGQRQDGRIQQGQLRDRQEQRNGRGQPGEPRQNALRGGFDSLRSFAPNRGRDPNRPLTGEDFKNWSDRLRDVEEMVEDPELRAEVARVRDRARAMRIDVKRHSKEPKWSLVRTGILEPMIRLENRLNQEIARRASKDALVPIDRDPVPNRYAEMVRRYYEELGRAGAPEASEP